MNKIDFLERVFKGYVLSYRRNLWHSSSGYADMTAADLQFFSELGILLGYSVRREMNWANQRDLCWCDGFFDPRQDNDRRTILYLERENLNQRFLGTVMKMLGPSNAPAVPFLVLVSGWVRQENLDASKNLVRAGLGDHRAFMAISWVGEKQNGDGFRLSLWIRSGATERAMELTPRIDSAGFWCLFDETVVAGQ